MKKLQETIADSLLLLLAHGAGTALDLTWAMTTTMPESVRRFRLLRNNSELSPGRELVAEIKEKRAAYKKLQMVLKRLHGQELIAPIESKDEKHKKWQLTKKGIEMVTKQRSEASLEQLTVPGRLTIIAYDIPERIRSERNRLRELLALMEFQQIQKSVWFANKKVTKEFVALLSERRLLDFVQIFEVNKSGTIERNQNNS